MAKPKLALIPSAQGSKFYSVLPSSGVGDFNFTRSGSATRINSQGLIETVGNGVSRLNYPLIDGKVAGCPSHLLEPQKINQLQRSQEFSNSYWINNGVTITENNEISPDGTLNADLLTGVSGGFGVVRFSTWSATNKVASCFAKKGSTELFKIANGSGGVGGVTFNLENGIVITEDSGFEGSIENYGNGWFRCTAIDTSARSGTFSLGVTAASESVYIWGAQLESDYLTSYIPTTNSAVTRSAETANGAGDASTFNDSEGVLMAEISGLDNGGSYRVISIEPTTGTANRIILYYDILANKIVGRVDSGGSVVFNYTADVQSQSNFNRIALKYKVNDFSLWINGFKLGSDNLGATPTGLNKLTFDNGSPSDFFYGNTKQIQYFDSALNNSDLEKLTSWTSFTDMANGQQYSIK